MDFVPILIATAMISTALAAMKMVTNKRWNDLATLAVLVGVGIGVAFLLAESNFSGGIDVGGVALADLNGASTILFGYALSASARQLYELKKAVDSADSAAEPKLFPPAGGGGE